MISLRRVAIEKGGTKACSISICTAEYMLEHEEKGYLKSFQVLILWLLWCGSRYALLEFYSDSTLLTTKYRSSESSCSEHLHRLRKVLQGVIVMKSEALQGHITA